MASGVLIRRYYCDFDSEKLIVVDSQDAPDGALVEEIDAREFYLRAGHHLSCGWPAQHFEGRPDICRCGFVFPDRAPADMHLTPDDDALA